MDNFDCSSCQKSFSQQNIPIILDCQCGQSICFECIQQFNNEFQGKCPDCKQYTKKTSKDQFKVNKTALKYIIKQDQRMSELMEFSDSISNQNYENEEQADKQNLMYQTMYDRFREKFSSFQAYQAVVKRHKEAIEAYNKLDSATKNKIGMGVNAVGWISKSCQVAFFAYKFSAVIEKLTLLNKFSKFGASKWTVGVAVVVTGVQIASLSIKYAKGQIDGKLFAKLIAIRLGSTLISSLGAVIGCSIGAFLGPAGVFFGGIIGGFVASWVCEKSLERYFITEIKKKQLKQEKLTMEKLYKNALILIGASQSYTDQEIKKIFHYQFKKLHPDKLIGRPDKERQQKTAQFINLMSAYQVIKEKRGIL